MRCVLIAAVAVLGAASAAAAAPAKATGPRPDQAAFRELYKELIETNTTLSTGSCTLASEKLAVRLKAAGYADKDVEIVVPPDQPRQGALIATLAGTDARLKPILLLAHLDVVEANRADWERDPFTLIEENGFFYARGASDDKAMAAAFADNMIRYKREGLKPKRSLRLALTCGEETPDNFNGVEWLIANRPELLDAEFALNEGAGGQIDANGRKVFLGIQAGEKVYQDFTLRITNPGGHSSRPVKDNAIVRLSAGLTRIGAYDFPIALNEATRNHYARMADIEGGETGAAMKALAADPSDAAAATFLARAPGRNSMMRTTCVPTQVKAGHAPNARREGRGCSQGPDPGDQRSGDRRGDRRQAQPGLAPAAPERPHHGARDHGGVGHVAWRPHRTGHGDRGHGRPVPAGGRRSDLWPVGHVQPARRQRRARPERAHRRPGPL